MTCGAGEAVATAQGADMADLVLVTPPPHGPNVFVLNFFRRFFITIIYVSLCVYVNTRVRSLHNHKFAA